MLVFVVLLIIFLIWNLLHYLCKCSIYGVHDEAKDKDFELEMSWVCDESNRQHEKVRQGVLWVTFMHWHIFLSITYIWNLHSIASTFVSLHSIASTFVLSVWFVFVPVILKLSKSNSYSVHSYYVSGYYHNPCPWYRIKNMISMWKLE